ncbi:unnamed protein product [Microthlaspi erraticum]|uniref:DUF7912 domain-containing protein n=1 Tax=Microthlaspi erraticum TaxID=1685480 RepID=A0A6D2HEY9_9BRAS|nr:unnamed protein product [Microthlaspi erraticum]
MFTILKLVLILTMLVALFTLYRSPPLLISETRSTVTTDPRYTSTAEINWNNISHIVDNYLSGGNKNQTTAFLNLNDNEVIRWKEVTKSDSQHVPLHLDHAASNITWESLYPEWIDEEEESKVPTCPSLPWIQVLGKPRIDLVVAKLPCNKSGKWSRDVARLHLQLAAARVASSSKGLHDVHVILISDCLPIPNLFTGQELLARQGNTWLYKPNPNLLRQKLNLPIGSCELSVPLQAKDNFYSSNEKKEAYATILHSAEDYVCGAIAAAQSIRMSGSTRDLVILVDDSITEQYRTGLESAGWKIQTFERIRNPKAKPNAYNEWNYSKFRLWQLTQYEKIIFIDADMLILRNIDFLFEMPEITATGNDGTLFNSGLMVVEPSNSTFRLLMDRIDEIVSYNGGDQGYLNEIFTWWHRIPKHMNFLKHFWEGDEPEVKELKTRLFGSDPLILYVLHYLGYNKPWLCFRDYDCNWNVNSYQQFASDEAHATWWRVHDAMPERLQRFCLLRTKQKAQLEWDRRQAEKGDFRDGHWKIKIRDERLQNCFESFCNWESMLEHWADKNGLYGNRELFILFFSVSSVSGRINCWEKMDLIYGFRPIQSSRGISFLPHLRISNHFLSSSTSLRFGFPAPPFIQSPKFCIETHARKSKKRTSIAEPKPNKVEKSLFEEEELSNTNDEEEAEEDVLNELLTDDEDDDFYLDDEEFEESEEELYAGDGGGGGGIKLAGTLWDKEALTLAEKVCDSFNGELGIYAFKTLPNSTIQVRIERLTNKFGSPTMEDIEAYSKIYRAKLAEAELAKSIPDSISLEVSSPGVERVVRIPQDLDRYKDRPMYVRYGDKEAESDGDGIFRLVSYDVEAKSCVWGIADIRVNREKAGKGRPLSKKQREWRLETSFESLRLVRLHSEC